MLRVTTIYATSAGSAAAYYTKYLADSPGEVPGIWTGRQATALGLVGDVSGDDLLALSKAVTPYRGHRLAVPSPTGPSPTEAWCARSPDSTRPSRRRSR